MRDGGRRSRALRARESRMVAKLVVDRMHGRSFHIEGGESLADTWAFFAFLADFLAFRAAT